MYEDLLKGVREKKEKEISRVIALYEQAIELIDKGQYEQACIILKKAVEPSECEDL